VPEKLRSIHQIILLATSYSAGLKEQRLSGVLVEHHCISRLGGERRKVADSHRL
jgi:hypothetical protein